MKDIRNLVDEYQHGDAEKRLNLFLECPELRDTFIQVEQDEALRLDESESQPTFNQSRKGKIVFYPCARLLKWCQSLI